MGKTGDHPPSQIEKFKEAAREAETDDSEEAFDRALKKVAKAKPTGLSGRAGKIQRPKDAK